MLQGVVIVVGALHPSMLSMLCFSEGILGQLFLYHLKGAGVILTPQVFS